ncbi:MAG TPA: hypothetical protein VLO07_06305 [Thermoanaerobaculia bacterium]|nr:hypothetical protein [Thermoanaerobaculia bacterium]
MNENTSNPPPPATPTAGQTPASQPTPIVQALPPIVERKSPGLAGFLSMFPGVGHLYLGLYQRAFAFAGAFVVCIGLSRHRGEFFGPLIFFLWVFAIIDAVRQAKAINRGHAVESGLASPERLRKAAEGTGALTWGVILVGLGGLWLVDRYVDLERFWDAMGDWGGPAAFVLLGLILIATHVKRKRREHESGVGMPPRSS